MPATRWWAGLKCVLMLLGAGLLLAAFSFLVANAWVVARTFPYIESTSTRCGPAEVGVVFGTSHWTRSGMRNPHFHSRMRTAATLVHAGRVEQLLLSGDNRTRTYNEPRAMWQALTQRNIDASRLTLDFAGFSTFDTLVRAQHVFLLDKAVLITQRWHLPRAVFIGRALGMEVVGCVANDHTVRGEWRLQVREWFARVAMLGDLYIWQREPYFLGPAEPILPHDTSALRAED